MANLSVALVFDAVDRTKGALSSIGQGIGAIAAKGRSALSKIEESTSGVTGAVAGLGLGIATGIGVSELIKTSDAMHRMEVLSGRSAQEIRGGIFEAAKSARVSVDEMSAALVGVKSGGKNLDFFNDNITTLGQQIQIVGGHGEELGQTLALISSNLDIDKPREMAESISVLVGQMKAAHQLEFLGDIAPKLQSILPEYHNVTKNSGIDAVRDIGAVVNLVGRGTNNPRQAVSETKGLLEFIQSQQGKSSLNAIGIDVYKDKRNPDAGTRRVTDILRDVAAKYAEVDPNDKGRQTRLDMILPSSFRRASSYITSEVRSKGSSPLLDELNNMQPNIEKDADMARRLGESWSGTGNAISSSVKKTADSLASLLEPAAALAAPYSDQIALTVALTAGIGGLGGMVRYLAFSYAGLKTAVLALNGSPALIRGLLTATSFGAAGIVEKIGVMGAAIPGVGRVARGVSSALLKTAVAASSLPGSFTGAIGSMARLGLVGLGNLQHLPGLLTQGGLSALSFAARMGGVGAVLPMLGGLFSAVSAGIGMMGATLMATPIGWVIAGIAAIAGAAYLIYEYWGPITGFVGALWDGVSTLTVGALGWIKDMIGGTPLGDAAIKTFGAIGTAASGAWDLVAGICTLDSDRTAKGLGEIWSGFEDYWGGLWDGVSGVAGQGLGVLADLCGIDSQQVIAGLSGLWDKFKAYWSGLWDGAVSLTGDALASIKGVIGGTPLGDAAIKAFGGITTVASGAWETIAGICTLDSDRAAKGLGEIWSGFEAYWGGLWDGVSGVAGQGLGALADLCGIDSQQIITGLSGIWDNFKGYWSGLWDGIGDKVGKTWAQVRSYLPTWLGGDASPGDKAASAIREAADRKTASLTPIKIAQDNQPLGLRGLGQPINQPLPVSSSPRPDDKTKQPIVIVKEQKDPNPFVKPPPNETASMPPAPAQVYGPPRQNTNQQPARQQFDFRLVIDGLPEGATIRKVETKRTDTTISVDRGASMAGTF